MNVSFKYLQMNWKPHRVQHWLRHVCIQVWLSSKNTMYQPPPPYNLVGMLLCNQAIEHRVVAFSELLHAVHWQGKAMKRLVIGAKVLIYCQNINYSSDGRHSCNYWKGWWVSTKSGPLSIVYIRLGLQKLSVIWNSRVSAIQRYLKCWSEWKDSWDSQNCSLYCGCLLLRGVVKCGSTVWWYGTLYTTFVLG